MYEQNCRRILAAPGVGMIHGSYGSDQVTLSDRRANGEAFPGERVVRVPRRAVRTYHQRWLLEGSLLVDALAE